MKSRIKTTWPQKSLISHFRNWHILLLPVILFFCGCRSTEKSPDKKETKNDFPYEKTFTGERKTASRQLAQNYIDALNQALKTGDFLHLKKVLPQKIRAKKANEIFKSLQAALAKLGTLESCEYYGMLDCTFFVDHLWKYRFVKNTGDSRLPQQSFEVLYRIRLIHPEKSPQIINADFIFR